MQILSLTTFYAKWTVIFSQTTTLKPSLMYRAMIGNEVIDMLQSGPLSKFLYSLIFIEQGYNRYIEYNGKKPVTESLNVRPTVGDNNY